jgi:hypothetical protein
VIAAALFAIGSASMPYAHRRAGVQIFESICTARGALFKRDVKLAEDAFRALFESMQRPEMTEEWPATAIESEAEERTDYYIGRGSMITFCPLMDGELLWALGYDAVRANAAAPAWQSRVASLTLLGLLVEACTAQVAADLNAIVESIVLPNATHEHPCVRSIAVKCIRQFSLYFQTEGFQQQYAGAVLPLLCDRIGRHECRRVRFDSADAISDFLRPFTGFPGADGRSLTLTNEQRGVLNALLEPFLTPLCDALCALTRLDAALSTTLLEAVRALTILIAAAHSRLRSREHERAAHEMRECFQRVASAAPRPQDTDFAAAQELSNAGIALLSKFIDK